MCSLTESVAAQWTHRGGLRGLFQMVTLDHPNYKMLVLNLGRAGYQKHRSHFYVGNV